MREQYKTKLGNIKNELRKEIKKQEDAKMLDNMVQGIIDSKNNNNSKTTDIKNIHNYEHNAFATYNGKSEVANSKYR